MQWTGWERALVNGEALDRRLLQRLAEARNWVAVVEVVEVALALRYGAGHIQAGLAPCARERDIAPLLETGAA